MTDNLTPQLADETPPVIWGKPATWEEDDPILPTFTHWLCPHCGANLVKADRAIPMHGNKNEYICLNACHLTAPQHAEFQGGVMKAAADTGFWDENRGRR